MDPAHLGHDKVAVLNGGLKKWLAEDVRDRRNAGAGERMLRRHVRPCRRPIEGTASRKSGEPGRAGHRCPFRRAASPQSRKEARPGLRLGPYSGQPQSSLQRTNQSPDGRTSRCRRTSRKAFETSGSQSFQNPSSRAAARASRPAALAFGLHLAGKDDVAICDGAGPNGASRAIHRSIPAPVSAMSALSPALTETLRGRFGDRYLHHAGAARAAWSR